MKKSIVTSGYFQNNKTASMGNQGPFTPSTESFFNKVIHMNITTTGMMIKSNTNCLKSKVKFLKKNPLILQNEIMD